MVDRVRRPATVHGQPSAIVARSLRIVHRQRPPSLETWEGDAGMYSILYIIGAIVVIIVVLRLLGLY